MDVVQIVVTVACSMMGSSGLWMLLTKLADKKDNKTKMLIGLGHDRIVSLGMEYISRNPQYITDDEYENLHEYLYKPYSQLGGNGSAERIMKEIDKIPIRSSAKDE